MPPLHYPRLIQCRFEMPTSQASKFINFFWSYIQMVTFDRSLEITAAFAFRCVLSRIKAQGDLMGQFNAIHEPRPKQMAL